MRLSGGRTWRAHFEFIRINIEPIILRKKIEDLRQPGGTVLEGAAVEGVAIIEVATAPTPCRW